jgi:IS30 family transposase
VGLNTPNAMINRQANSPFWTPQTDKILRKLQRAEVPLEKIAGQLNVTPNSIQRRLYHLRGTVPPYASETSVLRARISKLPKEKRARRDALLAAMQSAIKDGMWRDRAICEARMLGVRARAIADTLGVTRQTIYRILVLQGAPERELKERAKKRRKENARVFRSAKAALRLALARGVSRDRAIVKAAGAGLSYAAIGKKVGLTRERVRQIIAAHEM